MSDEIGEDIRSAMEEAVGESTETVADTPVETPVLSEEDNQRARDAAGRFVAAQNGEAEEAPLDGPVKLTADKPPSSWTPAARELWKDLPDAAKHEIIRREQDAANRNHSLQEQYAPAEQVLQGLGSVLQEARNFGVDGVGYIRQTMETERVLRTAEMPDKFQALLRVADTYGIPLREIVNQSVGQEVLRRPSQEAQVNPQIAAELAEIRQWREEQEFGQVVNQVEGWGAQKEFFEDVRNVMADLTERGMANNIEDAYDKACWMVPEVREVLLARNGQGATQNSVAQRQRAAVGVSKAPSKPNVALNTDNPNASIADTVRDAFYGGNGGRV